MIKVASWRHYCHLGELMGLEPADRFTALPPTHQSQLEIVISRSLGGSWRRLFRSLTTPVVLHPTHLIPPQAPTETVFELSPEILNQFEMEFISL